MRWDIIYKLAILYGAFSTPTEAFMAPRRQHGNGLLSPNQLQLPVTDSALTMVGGLGWDNDNFLESLNKGDDAINEANEQYHRLKKFGTESTNDPVAASSTPSPSSTDDELPEGDSGAIGAELSKEQIERIKQRNEEETAQGGEMFKRLMERAQQGSVSRPPPELSVPPPPPPQAQQPAPASGGPALPAGFEKLSVEAQAALFRELMSNPGGSTGPAIPTPNTDDGRPPAMGQAEMGRDGRRIGRNRDADSLVNSSDLYFARLKRDSTMRNIARYSGDIEKAEDVFGDPSIQEIKLHVNPYMEEARKKEQELLETAADEMILPEMFESQPINRSDPGISYKKKLEMMKAKKQGTSTSSVPTSASSVESTTLPNPVTSEPLAEPKPVETSSAPATTTQQESVSSSINSKSAEEIQRDIRTLMGLLLKHRGGPGFGSGRIQGAEIERFESLSQDLLETLRNEPSAPEENVAAQPPAQSSTSVGSVAPAVQPSAPAAPASTAGNSVGSMISCIEGVVLMYKNSPPALQSSVIVTMRAALDAAISTCNELIGDTAPPGQSIPPADNINNAISCIEGAILMYKNSPPALQPTVLVTLRAALIAGVNTCNVQPGGNQGYAAAQTSAPATSTPIAETAAPQTMSSPAPAKVEPTYSGDDENSKFLELVYEKLKGAAGDGKLGLKEDLSAEEAEDLANDISRMRMMLVDELDGGIPEANESSSTSPSGQTTPGTSSASKYQDMLAKARAEKENKDYQ